MTWTYDPALSTDKDKVRTLIGDTNDGDQLLTDEQIAFFLSETGSDLYEAAAKSVEAIIALLARDVDRSNIGMSVSRSQKIQHYQDLLGRLRSANNQIGAPEFGGGSINDKINIENDPDFPGPITTREENTRLPERRHDRRRFWNW